MPRKKPPTHAIGPLDAFVKRLDPPKRRGRPRKNKRGAGRKKKINDEEKKDKESDKAEDLDPYASERLRRAQDEWRRREKKPGMSRRKLAVKYGVSKSTLSRYIANGRKFPVHRRNGRKPRYLSHESRQVIVETIIRYDRGDRGLNRQECSRIVQELAIEPVTLKQANNQVDYIRRLDRR